ncbi:PAS domain-containing sensor histidine kinase, partial [Staphylococcus epidermidis]|nr:PAS domain-containing sensor histidine kinase [Staphylococcus epidermidis]
MLKFHLRLLLLISTITIISFIGLGAIIHNTIYQTLTSNQIKSLDSEARNHVNALSTLKGTEHTNISLIDK